MLYDSIEDAKLESEDDDPQFESKKRALAAQLNCLVGDLPDGVEFIIRRLAGRKSQLASYKGDIRCPIEI